MQPDENEFEDTMEDGLYVNFSDQEAATEGRVMEPVPTGSYLCTITDVDLKESTSEKNPGKKYYAIQFEIVEDKRAGEHVGRKIWTNAMLFSPALYTIVQIMKAIGMNVNSGRGRIPEPAELIGQIVMVYGVLQGEKKDKNDPSKTYAPRYEVKSVMSKDKWTQGGSITGKKASASARSSLLS